MARFSTALGVLVCLAGAGPAVAQGAKPDWVAVPTREDMCRAYPETAREQGAEGGATLICDVSPDDMLENCSVQKETPQGMRFGEAAMSVAGLYTLRPSTWPMGVPVRFVVSFKPPCKPEAGR
jgi:hypothetical protein